MTNTYKALLTCTNHKIALLITRSGVRIPSPEPMFTVGYEYSFQYAKPNVSEFVSS